MVFQYIEKAIPERLRGPFGKAALRAYYAEFAGMVFFLGISVGTVVASRYVLQAYELNFLTTSGSKLGNENSIYSAQTSNAMVLTVAFAFGMCILVLVYSIGHISGGHFNPAVTFALLCFRKISIIKAICYIISQILGATVGVALVKALYWTEAGEATKYGTNAPAQGIDDWQAIVLELLGTSVLTYVVFGVAIDAKATPLVNHMAPFAIGYTVFLAHLLLIPMTGCGINPARSTASAIVSGDYSKLWIYWVGPMIGGPVGAAIHYIPLQMGDTIEDTNKAMNMGAADNPQQDGDASDATPGGVGNGAPDNGDNGVETTNETPGAADDKK